jgi:radical SAM protein with 4Fe4S-binding SPASM domain
MCSIWKIEEYPEMAAADYGFLPSSLKTVNISGGEPYLRDDLVKLLSVVRSKCRDARIIISTNGLLTEKIVDMTRQCLDSGVEVGVNVSIDGLESTHDQIRGIEGAFKRAWRTLTALKELGLDDLGIAFTVSDQNVDQLTELYKRSKDMGVNFALAVVHNSELYFHTDNNRIERHGDIACSLDRIMTDQLKSLSTRKWAKAFFDYGIYHFLTTGGRITKCDALEGFFFLDPAGDLYPCNILDEKIGNVVKEGFDELWFSDKAYQVRKKVKACRTPCWMVCTAASSVRKHPLKVAGWVFPSKVRAHLGGRLIAESKQEGRH